MKNLFLNLSVALISFLFHAENIFSQNFWQQINGPYRRTINTLAINSSGHIFVGTYDGVFRSTDNGGIWAQVNTGLTNTSVCSLTINSSGHIFAGTCGGGVFRSVQSTTSIKETNTAIISSFVLMQNYPNPFNPSTTIKFALPERAKINLSVYNLLGEKVAELVSGEMDADYHETQWNASRFASGVYFYTLQAGKYIETKKLILMK